MLINITLILFSSLTLSSQNPSFIWENCEMSASWYRQQATAWELKVNTDPADADAWLNYFKAERFALIASGMEPASSKLDSIVVRMKRNVPDHANTYYISYWNDRDNPQAFQNLVKAEQLRPGEWRFYDDFVRYYEHNDNKTQKIEYLRKWNQTHPYLPVIDEMSANLLRATGSNAVIISSGYSDTYSLWLYQQKSGRYDKPVIMLEMLKEPGYRSRKLKELGMKDPMPGLAISNDAAFIKALLTMNPAREIHMTLNHEQTLLNGLSSYLYLTGLTFHMSMKALDNIPILQANWKTFRYDELNKLCGSSALQRSERILSSYLMPLVVLYEEEQQGEKKARGGDYKNKAECVARMTGKTKQLERIMQQIE